MSSESYPSRPSRPSRIRVPRPLEMRKKASLFPPSRTRLAIHPAGYLSIYLARCFSLSRAHTAPGRADAGGVRVAAGAGAGPAGPGPRGAAPLPFDHCPRGLTTVKLTAKSGPAGPGPRAAVACATMARYLTTI